MQSLYDTGVSNQIPATYDGAVYALAVDDCICGGIGDEFAISYNASSLQVSFQNGSQAVIGGAFFKCDENKSVTLAANSTIYLCARIDKTQQNGQTALFYQNTESSMKKENLNGDGNIRDLLLYVITTSSSGVANVVDKRVIRTRSSTSIGGYGIWAGTQAQYDALPIKDNNTLYFIEE